MYVIINSDIIGPNFLHNAWDQEKQVCDKNIYICT